MRFHRAMCPVVVLAAAFVQAGAASAIDPQYLSLNDCPDQPGCAALILLDETELDNSSTRSKYSVHRLIKVFTKEGVETWADVEAPTAVGGYSVRNLEGRTVLPDGKEIPLKQDNVFVKYLKSGKRWAKRKTAKFPGVVPGAIIDYSYDVLTEPNSYLIQVEWEVQQSLPVLQSRFTLKPGKYNFEWKKTGIEPIQVKEERPFKNAVYYSATSVPPLLREPYGPPEEAVRVRYHFNLPELTANWLGAYAGRVAGKSEAFTREPAGVAAKVAELVAPADPPLEKVRKIYGFVQEKIGTEEMRAGATEEKALEEAKDAGEVLRRGFGSEYERTMLFMAMVRATGLDHGVLLITGKFSSALTPEVDDEDQFDSFATAVKTGSNNWTFYDPATRHCPFGMISPEKEGGKTRNAVLITPAAGAGEPRKAVVQNLHMTTYAPTGFSLAAVPFSAAGKNLLKRQVKATMRAEGGLEVAVNEQGTGLVDLDHKQDYELLDETERQEKLRERLGEIFTSAELVSAQFQDLDSFDKPAVLTYNFRLPGDPATADRLIVSPSIFHASEPMPFTAETRRTNVLFQHARKTQEIVSYVPPPGFEVEEVPAPVVVKDPPFSLVIAYALSDGALTMTRNLEIDAGEWPAADYPRLRSFFEKVQEADRQVVTLKKTAP
ncbi:MAG: DUF3857 domain-containing protein [Candidatus Polarisedimenticolia bacterium]